MVPAIALPSVSRRRVLAGAASALALGTVGVGAAAPTALPDQLTDEATKHYPTPPEVAEIWQPTVTETHASAVVERLADVVDRGETLWSRLDTGRRFTGAGGWLENARESLDAGNYNDALFEATYGLQFAAEQLGEARAELDRVDLQALGERTVAVRDRIDAVLESVDEYRVGDPGTDLAWYRRIESELHRASRRANWSGATAAADGVDDENGPDTGDVDANDVRTFTRAVELAEVNALNAERFRDHLQDRLGGDATPYADHLAGVAEEFRRELDARPTEERLREQYVGDPDEYGPHEFAQSRLARWCFNVATPGTWQLEDAPELRVTKAMTLGSRIVGHRAHDFATSHLVVDETDADFDSGHALAEKRRARRTYQDATGGDPEPLLALQAGRAIEDLQVAVVGFAGNYRDPLWKERLQAYLYALAGRAKLEHHPDVYERIADEN